MRSRTVIAVCLGLCAAASNGAAQTPGALPPAVRTVIAASKLTNVADKPLNFRTVSLNLGPGQKGEVTGMDGVLYVRSGTVQLSSGGENTNVGPETGAYIAFGKTAALSTVGNQPMDALYFMLTPGTAKSSVANGQISVKDL